jgi:hypothetical protein
MLTYAFACKIWTFQPCSLNGSDSKSITITVIFVIKIFDFLVQCRVKTKHFADVLENIWKWWLLLKNDEKKLEILKNLFNKCISAYKGTYPTNLLGEMEVRKHWSTKYYCNFTIQYKYTVINIPIETFHPPASLLKQRIDVHVFVTTML